MKSLTQFGLVCLLSSVVLTGPSGSTAAAQPPEKKQSFGNAVGRFFVEWMGGRLLDMAVDSVTGKPDTSAIQQQLNFLAQRESAHASDIRSLQSQIDKCATREEVRVAMQSMANRIDATLGAHATRLHQLEVDRRKMQEEQAKLWKDLGLTQQEVARLGARVEIESRRNDVQDLLIAGQGKRLSRVEAELAELKRWDNAEMSMRLAVAGVDHIERSNYKEAIRFLTQAHAYAPEDPGVPYMAAIAHHMNGNAEMADLWMAKGIAAEQEKIPGQWFTNVLPRYQGTVRTWFNTKRYDPELGRKASGEIRIIEVLPPSRSLSPGGGR